MKSSITTVTRGSINPYTRIITHRATRLTIATRLGHGVTIVTAFEAFVSRTKVLSVDTVTTEGQPAPVRAAVTFVFVAIVTGFAVVNPAVTTTLQAADGVASIPHVGISVITGFAMVDPAVATGLD